MSAVSDIPSVPRTPRIARSTRRAVECASYGGAMREGSLADSVEIVKTAYGAFARGDLPAFLALLDPEVAWSEASGFPSVGGTHIGPQAVVAALTQVAADWDGLTVTADEYFSAGDQVVVLGETQGRHRVTGKTFRSPFAHVLRVRGDRIVAWRAHIDTALAQEAARPD